MSHKPRNLQTEIASYSAFPFEENKSASGYAAAARVKRVLFCGNAVPRAARTPVSTPAFRRGLNRAGSETGAPAHQGRVVSEKMSAKSANATSMRHQSHPNATPKLHQSHPEVKAEGGRMNDEGPAKSAESHHQAKTESTKQKV
jgi:hypothetical protein